MWHSQLHFKCCMVLLSMWHSQQPIIAITDISISPSKAGCLYSGSFFTSLKLCRRCAFSCLGQEKSQSSHSTLSSTSPNDFHRSISGNNTAFTTPSWCAELWSPLAAKENGCLMAESIFLWIQQVYNNYWQLEGKKSSPELQHEDSLSSLSLSELLLVAFSLNCVTSIWSDSLSCDKAWRVLVPCRSGSMVRHDHNYF